MAGKSASGAADKAEMIRWLFENSRDLMQVIGADGRFKLVNGAWKSLTGWDEADLLGERALDFLNPDDIASVRDRIRGLRPGEVAENPMRVKRRDGAWGWFASRTQKMANGELIVTLRDATEERARAEELEETRRMRRELSESAGIGTWLYEPLEDRIEWSQDLLSLTGFDIEDIATPDQFYARVHPKDRESTRRLMAHAVQTGEGTSLEHRMKVGGRWTSWRATFRTLPRAGGVFALKGISEEITELAKARDAARRGELKMKKLQREAQASAQRLAVALEAAEAGVYEIDHVSKAFWASPEFAKITGQVDATYEQATQLRFPGFHPDDLDHVRESFRALHTGTSPAGAFDARIVRTDGETRWIRVSHHLKVGKNGRWLKAVGLIQDFDARKRQELALVDAQKAAEAAAEAKSSFLANMSHEIRTPMNGVMGVLHLLKGEKLTEEGRHMLEEALSCGQMLAELLNDVIDFSKIEAGRLELADEPLDPRILLEGVIRLLRPQAEAKGLLLRLDADANLGWVRSDPVRLRQALFNLVGNAVKFTERGSVTIRCQSPRPGFLRFEVIDTGVGIPAEAQGRIFQRFDQGDASTTRKFGGSGLGLAITKKLAEMMSGAVGFSSEEGLGSNFWLEIEAPAAEAAVETYETLEPVLDGLRVLVVEDNPTNRMIATKLLESLGAQVATAADGYLGVEAAEHGDFHLILMDVQMPGIDGLEAARRIRALGGAPAETPIVALTANVLAHQRRAYLDAGMDGVVGKPISPGVLLREIARLSAPVDAFEETVAA
ncbi:MAG TPA: PAS domain S-box protein [Phenylobacterium sp.]|jgi:PAS domain S-box-containing protein|uniref:PAS domain-containing hybrid sensor histidine kinase/response regulator n=1 Tax=Phenylobacterium sp. TaxID=1871053 RepID=UPI002D5E8C42|nr:PAS domain S-box protein [Phenylobacterium sp.]HZZ69391.1 PAS domain S-box protein [Phenylobacterium sp.]